LVPRTPTSLQTILAAEAYLAFTKWADIEHRKVILLLLLLLLLCFYSEEIMTYVPPQILSALSTSDITWKFRTVAVL
jgi:hypothetical protein